MQFTKNKLSILLGALLIFMYLLSANGEVLTKQKVKLKVDQLILEISTHLQKKYYNYAVATYIEANQIAKKLDSSYQPLLQIKTKLVNELSTSARLSLSAKDREEAHKFYTYLSKIAPENSNYKAKINQIEDYYFYRGKELFEPIFYTDRGKKLMEWGRLLMKSRSNLKYKYILKKENKSIEKIGTKSLIDVIAEGKKLFVEGEKLYNQYKAKIKVGAAAKAYKAFNTLAKLNPNYPELNEYKDKVKKFLWFHPERKGLLIAILVLTFLIIYFIYSAKSGKSIFIRRIAGLSAIDDAVGRATEMGKPVLYIPGIMDMDDIQTLAGVSILGHVAYKTAEYETPLLVPTSRSIVLSAAQEVVKEAYLRAGKPDAYKPENLRYLTDDQFGFTAGVDGIMVREKPAANFYMGCFYAESLILAETGNSIGSIQIAGTAMPSQLPFFVAACDYTLIGEELFAASAYISNDPKELGSLKGQDIGKGFLIVSIIIGFVLETIAALTNNPEFHFFINWFKSN